MKYLLRKSGVNQRADGLASRASIRRAKRKFHASLDTRGKIHGNRPSVRLSTPSGRRRGIKATRRDTTSSRFIRNSMADAYNERKKKRRRKERVSWRTCHRLERFYGRARGTAAGPPPTNENCCIITRNRVYSGA